RRRFLKEAQATAQLSHDNIVTILQVGEDTRHPYIVMQLLQGETLAGRLKRAGKLEPRTVVAIGSGIASGLAAAHASGLIHRDIKPANIWLEEGTDRPKILDFGLVQAAGVDARQTQSGVIVGTPEYLA